MHKHGFKSHLCTRSPKPTANRGNCAGLSSEWQMYHTDFNTTRLCGWETEREHVGEKKIVECTQGSIKIVTITITHLNVSLLHSSRFFFSSLFVVVDRFSCCRILVRYCYEWIFGVHIFFPALWFARTVNVAVFFLFFCRLNEICRALTPQQPNKKCITNMNICLLCIDGSFFFSSFHHSHCLISI